MLKLITQQESWDLNHLKNLIKIFMPNKYN